MRMRFTPRMIPLALALCASGCSGIGENDAAANADLRTLAGSEISRLLTGNTVLGRDRLGPFWMHYPSQGTVWGLASNGDVDIGRWWISGNHYCRAWRRWRGGAEQCWLVASDGSSRLLWIVPDGRSSAESTIEAGTTAGPTPVMFNETGRAKLVSIMSTFKTPFNVLVGSTLSVTAGQMVPQGKLDAVIQIRAHAGL